MKILAGGRIDVMLFTSEKLLIKKQTFIGKDTEIIETKWIPNKRGAWQ